MSTLLIKNIHTLVTMDAQRRELKDAAIFVRDGVIEYVGDSASAAQYEAQADKTLSLSKHIVMPGMVNTHHHMSQNLTRVVAQQNELFDWLTTLYPIWIHLTGDMVYTAAKMAMAELILSGCTSSSDHLYLYPNDVKLENTIQAAQEIGMRFHPTRGAMSVGESNGGLPPDKLVEPDENAILKEMQRLIETYHHSSRYSMLHIGVAPCSPFTVSQDLMRESAALARSYKVRLHTHLAENVKDIDYSLSVFGLRPGDYIEDVGWVGDDVWHAHCVQLDDNEIRLFGRTGTGVCHCPSSNLRLASGIAPIRKMRDNKVKVGLGVDGSASNDGGHMLNEARMALLMQRAGGDPSAMSAREALEIATLGGASVLGRDDIGAIAPNMAADFVAYRIDHHAFAGAQHDLVAALLFCQSIHVDLSVINGKIVVQDGILQTLDLPVLVEQHNAYSRRLLNGE